MKVIVLASGHRVLINDEDIELTNDKVAQSFFGEFARVNQV